jgi:fibronectin-binding autotransporter adhesin
MTTAAANSASNIGINMNTLNAAGGVSLILGGIDFNKTNTTNLQIGNSSTTVNGILQLNGATINAVPNSLIRVAGSSNLTIANVNSGSGAQTMGLRLGTTNGVFHVDPNHILTIFSIISEAAANSSFTKTGAGTLVLDAANTYSGTTTVSQGTLLINNTSGSGVGSGPVTVLSSATLGGTGFLGTSTSPINLTVNSGGILAPGNSPGTLTVHGNATLSPGATFLVDILNPTTDLLVIAPGSTVNVTGAFLDGTWGGDSSNVFSGAFNADNMHWLIDNQNPISTQITGTFANSTLTPSFAGLFGGVDPHLVSIGGQLFAAFYGADYSAGLDPASFTFANLTSGNDLLLIAIPEPSRPLLLAAALTPLLRRRRRN